MTWLFLTLHVLLIVCLGLRILLRNDLQPDVRMGWLTLVVLLPYVSCVLYYLFGEVALRRRGRGHQQQVQDFAVQAHVLQQTSLVGKSRPHPAVAGATERMAAHVAPQWQAAFSYAASVNGFQPEPGHSAELMADGRETLQRMLMDLDAAQHEINLLYYLWRDDQMGTQVAQALVRAAARGVVCRAMVDGLGSRPLLGSALWESLRAAGVQLAVALPINRPLQVMLNSRLDLRNHRKFTLIDGRIAYCGSQNCVDEVFAAKAAYGAWVDIMLRMQGPVVAQMQLVFASDWQQYAMPEHAPYLPHNQPQALVSPGFVALAIAEGPSERARACPQLFATLITSARQELVLSTPYFVPDATVLDALCATAWRGVPVTLIVPARNDSAIVGAASRSHYHRLLQAGIAIYEFQPGLLHAKTLCVDGQVSLIGSTNLDLRSFDLNFENNVLLQDVGTTQAIRARQAAYIAQSLQITAEQVRAWPRKQRIWNNLLAMLSPVL